MTWVRERSLKFEPENTLTRAYWNINCVGHRRVFQFVVLTRGEARPFQIRDFSTLNRIILFGCPQDIHPEFSDQTQFARYKYSATIGVSLRSHTRIDPVRFAIPGLIISPLSPPPLVGCSR